MFAFRKPTFILPKILISLATATLAVIILMYILFQARFLIGGPQIQLTNEPDSVQTQPQVVITGITANITDLWLNGRPIVTDETGAFREAILLENGYTIVRIEAEDRYGRRTFVERPFVYVPDDNLQE